MSLLGQEVKVLLLAGGRGERFWPKSTRALPKQFLRVVGGQSLLRTAFLRATRLVQPDSIFVITGRQFAAITRSELPELPEGHIILEPEGRNTAPALGLAALWIGRMTGDAIVAALPSDHQVGGEAEFAGALLSAVEAARAGYLVTVGTKPTRPETGYGYIRTGPVIAQRSGSPVHAAAEFTEKPDRTLAARYCTSGKYLWNSGMLISRLSVLRSELERHVPALHQVLTEIEVSAPTDSALAEQVDRRFPAAPNVSFDYAVLERSSRVVTVPAAFAWDDLGDWSALARLHPADERGNVLLGDALVEDCSGLLVDSSGDRLVAALGVDDLVIVATAEAVLVCRKDRTQEVRKLAGPVAAMLSGSDQAPG